MMVKSGLEFFILKLNELLLAGVLSWQDNSLSGPFFLCWTATLNGLVQFQNKKILTTFHQPFYAKNSFLKELTIYSTYSNRSRWCELAPHESLTNLRKSAEIFCELKMFFYLL